MSGNFGAPAALEAGLTEVGNLLATDPGMAARRAAEILVTAPGHPVATLYLGAGRRLSGDPAASLQALQPLVQSCPEWAELHYELGQAYNASGRYSDAVECLRRAVELRPALPGAWYGLASALRALGNDAGADAVCMQRISLSRQNPGLVEAESALRGGHFSRANSLLRRHLQQDPTDVLAMHLLAEVGLRLDQIEDARHLLAHCLELAPCFTDARYTLAIALDRLRRHADALAEIGKALAAEPTNPAFRNVQAVLLGRIGEFDRANEVYAGFLDEYPDQPRTWMSYGHSLTAAGRQVEAIAAYRKSIQLDPELGEAWWSLANLKTFRFTAEDVAQVRRHLARAGLREEDRLHFEFALGKALEDAGDHEASFAHYTEGNRLRRRTVPYDPEAVTSLLQRSMKLFTPEFFGGRAGSGDPAADPIFIVGLPRAGSTLIEQILASHSAVEGTAELPDLIAVVRDLSEESRRQDGADYPEVLAGLDADAFRALGHRYLESTRIQRRVGAPRFIDKMPNNFAHVGLIHLMLPNAHIIDARRHPLACCLSNFKQLFARGQQFTYRLEDLGHYYREYVELMAHFDHVLPGRIHRVFYERLVGDTEAEVRRLLDHCGLPFEETCLRFHENKRVVRTVSSEQVRQPIHAGALDSWRNFERWLGPLKTALGPALETYPAVPDPSGPALRA